LKHQCEYRQKLFKGETTVKVATGVDETVGLGYSFCLSNEKVSRRFSSKTIPSKSL
jgi:hypothetical protein